MKKSTFILVCIACLALVGGIVFAAGEAGVTNAVNERTPADRMKEKVIEFNDDVVTALDAISALASGKVSVGSASGVATDVSISGDARLTSAGVLTAVGITTNIDVLVSGGGTNRMSFTNGILRVNTAL